MSDRQNELSVKQIESWRAVLTAMCGPYALIMPEDEIVRFKNRIESLASSSAAILTQAKGELEKKETLGKPGAVESK